MVRKASPFALVALLLMAGCSGTEEEFGTPGSGGSSGDQDDTGTADDTSTPDTDTDDPVEDETPYFEDPGDSVDFVDDAGDAEVDLTDQSETEAGSNQDQEFYLVLVNTGESELGYQLRYDVPSDDDTGDAGGDEGTEGPAAPRAAPARQGPSEFRRNLREAKASGRLGTASPDGAPPPPLDASDVGTARQEFRVRDSVTDDSSFDLVDAKLWALGERWFSA